MSKKEQSFESSPQKVPRREFLANLLFAGTSLSALALLDQGGLIAGRNPQLDEWKLPEDKKPDADWELPPDLMKSPPPKPEPRPDPPMIRGRMKVPDPPPERPIPVPQGGANPLRPSP